ncbi:hypothetical protein MAPG_04997 [Magnaporthiopsis poae ATCC 64411]|uniref:OTU domain-containing protein n=1 Tax=Magnaporthiopsis poae (strain ATCC 64411 / 73-15) TaxID=644358 RepID=A0A0C4DY86_MAGP6|nr:hypothetical protein MAPG_04997 [Magnaporthiopsis poae ATCC 64411]
MPYFFLGLGFLRSSLLQNILPYAKTFQPCAFLEISSFLRRTRAEYQDLLSTASQLVWDPFSAIPHCYQRIRDFSAIFGGFTMLEPEKVAEMTPSSAAAGQQLSSASEVDPGHQDIAAAPDPFDSQQAEVRSKAWPILDLPPAPREQPEAQQPVAHVPGQLWEESLADRIKYTHHYRRQQELGEDEGSQQLEISVDVFWSSRGFRSYYEPTVLDNVAKDMDMDMDMPESASLGHTDPIASYYSPSLGGRQIYVDALGHYYYHREVTTAHIPDVADPQTATVEVASQENATRGQVDHPDSAQASADGKAAVESTTQEQRAGPDVHTTDVETTTPKEDGITAHPSGSPVLSHAVDDVVQEDGIKPQNVSARETDDDEIVDVAANIPSSPQQRAPNIHSDDTDHTLIPSPTLKAATDIDIAEAKQNVSQDVSADKQESPAPGVVDAAQQTTPPVRNVMSIDTITTPTPEEAQGPGPVQIPEAEALPATTTAAQTIQDQEPDGQVNKDVSDIHIDLELDNLAEFEPGFEFFLQDDPAALAESSTSQPRTSLSLSELLNGPLDLITSGEPAGNVADISTDMFSTTAPVDHDIFSEPMTGPGQQVGYDEKTLDSANTSFSDSKTAVASDPVDADSYILLIDSSDKVDDANMAAKPSQPPTYQPEARDKGKRKAVAEDLEDLIEMPPPPTKKARRSESPLELVEISQESWNMSKSKKRTADSQPVDAPSTFKKAKMTTTASTGGRATPPPSSPAIRDDRDIDEIEDELPTIEAIMKNVSSSPKGTFAGLSAGKTQKQEQQQQRPASSRQPSSIIGPGARHASARDKSYSDEAKRELAIKTARKAFQLDLEAIELDEPIFDGPVVRVRGIPADPAVSEQMKQSQQKPHGPAANTEEFVGVVPGMMATSPVGDQQPDRLLIRKFRRDAGIPESDAGGGGGSASSARNSTFAGLPLSGGGGVPKPKPTLKQQRELIYPKNASLHRLYGHEDDNGGDYDDDNEESPAVADVHKQRRRWVEDRPPQAAVLQGFPLVEDVEFLRAQNRDDEGNCYWNAVAMHAYGRRDWGPRVKLEHLRFVEAVLANERHPRHAEYARVNERFVVTSAEGVADPFVANMWQLLHLPGSWTPSWMTQVTADLYGLFVVLYTLQDEFGGIGADGRPVVTETTTRGSYNSRHIFLLFVDGNHYQPMIPNRHDAAEFRCPRPSRALTSGYKFGDSKRWGDGTAHAWRLDASFCALGKRVPPPLHVDHNMGWTKREVDRLLDAVFLGGTGNWTA